VQYNSCEILNRVDFLSFRPYRGTTLICTSGMPTPVSAPRVRLTSKQVVALILLPLFVCLTGFIPSSNSVRKRRRVEDDFHVLREKNLERPVGSVHADSVALGVWHERRLVSNRTFQKSSTSTLQATSKQAPQSKPLASQPMFAISEDFSTAENRISNGSAGSFNFSTDTSFISIKPSLEFSTEPGREGREDRQRTRRDYVPKREKVLVFTMDSLKSRERKAGEGGPLGEALIRKPLVLKLEELGFSVHTATSDEEFEQELSDPSYQRFILDPWTWARKGFIPKGRLATQAGIGKKTFILDFFGDSWQTAKAASIPGFDPKVNTLSMFPSRANLDDPSFIGFGVENASQIWGTTWEDVAGFCNLLEEKHHTNEIVVWGKDPNYLMAGDTPMSTTPPRLEYVFQFCEAFAALTATRTSTLVFSFSPDRTVVSKRIAQRVQSSACTVRYQGHSTQEVWRVLLRKAVAVVGVMDPLAGPTAIDALVAGALVVNPKMDRHSKAWVPRSDKGFAHSSSQHSFLEWYLEHHATGNGVHRICTVNGWDTKDLQRCAKTAYDRLWSKGESSRKLFEVPFCFTSEAYTSRVKKRFEVEDEPAGSISSDM